MASGLSFIYTRSIGDAIELLVKDNAAREINAVRSIYLSSFVHR